MRESKAKNILITMLAVLLIIAVGLCVFFLFKPKEEQKTPNQSGGDSEVVAYLKDQLTQTQQQLTDANILLQQYLNQLEEVNKNNAALTEQNQTLNSTIQSLQESIKSLNAEIQRLTALLEEYGDIANGTFEVHFYNGEDLVKLLLIRNNTKITETVTAEKEGYDFLGWALEGDKNQVVNYQDIEITQATNFYAVFERITGLFNAQDEKVKAWDELISQGEIAINDNQGIEHVSSSLSGHLIVPDEITSIRESAFENCDNLTVLDCYGVTYIADFAFQGCHKLKEINYNQESIAFGTWAFNDCRNLRSLKLPADTRFSSTGVILGTSALIEIVKDASLSDDEIQEAFSIDSNVIKTLNGIHTGESRIKTIDGVRYYIYNDWRIAVGAADERANIKLTDDCNLVWRNAFSYQDQLRNVALNKDLARLDLGYAVGQIVLASAFSNCTGLETIWMPFSIMNSFESEPLMLCNSNPTNLTIYFDKESLSDSDKSKLDNFIEMQTTNLHPTKITHYQLGYSRDAYLGEFKF